MRDKLRIRLRTLQDPEEYGDVFTVDALPPSEELPFGRSHCVLIRDPDAMAMDIEINASEPKEPENMDINGIQGKPATLAPVRLLTGGLGHLVVEVRLILRAICTDPTSCIHNKDLIYVQLFTRPAESAETGTKMYRVARKLSEDGSAKGMLIDISSVVRFIQLVPDFGTSVTSGLTPQNVMEICQYFYINPFSDKESYKAVY